MGVLLNRRRYMGTSKQAKTLFEMYNQDFDGTVNSVVDTGLKLWDGTHNRWKMEVVYQNLSGQASYTTLFTVRPDSSPYSGIRLRKSGTGNDFELTLSDSWNIIKNDGGFDTYVQAVYGNALIKDAPLDYDSLTIIRDGNTLFIDYNGYTATIQITDPRPNNLNLLIGCDYKGANNETQRYYTGTIQKFVISELGDFPYDAEVEYLKGDDKAYIDTGLYLNGQISVDCIFSITAVAANHCIYGARTGYQNTSFSLFTGTGVKIYSEYNNIGYNSSFSYTANSIYEVERNGNVVTYKDANGNILDTHTFTTVSFTTPYTCTLFAMHQSSVLITNANIKIHSFKMYDNNELVMDMIPVRVGTVGYMYDKVSGVLFGNEGTGAFIVGPDK